ncbi:MAG: acetyltransferase [Chromatiales bacterium]|nr:acetyltransferase [Chromatiales bacterium]
MSLPLIILGAGGHGRVLLDALRTAGANVQGFLDRDSGLHGGDVDGVHVFGDDSWLTGVDPESIFLVNGIGSVSDTSLRQRIYDTQRDAGFQFASAIHPLAYVSQGAALSEGSQVLALAVVQTGARVGADAIVNNAAVVEHDCQVADHAHIGCGAVLCGGVVVQQGAHIGAGATVLQGLTIGRRAVVGAGAVVTRSVKAGTTVVGVPAGVRPT